MTSNTVNSNLKPSAFTSDQEIRWCPGCGNYAILAQVKKVLADLNIPRRNIVFVSGIGCSSRFPYYLDTYGFHGIHGRALPIATGIKLARPDLSVWVVTGDGDGLSIGGNHLLHAIRRNIDINILLFNNRIYGLTKGQYSPTSEQGKKTKTSPHGVIDYPLRALSVAIGAEATFAARSVDIDHTHLSMVLHRAALHKGTSFVEIYQNCRIFNDGAFTYATDKSVRDDHRLILQNGQPLVFGKNNNKGIVLRDSEPQIVDLNGRYSASDLLVHDERTQEPTLAYMLSRMYYPDFPEPMGVFRAVARPCYNEQLDKFSVPVPMPQEIDHALEALYASGEVWEVAG